MDIWNTSDWDNTDYEGWDEGDDGLHLSSILEITERVMAGDPFIGEIDIDFDSPEMCDDED